MTNEKINPDIRKYYKALSNMNASLLLLKEKGIFKHYTPQGKIFILMTPGKIAYVKGLLKEKITRAEQILN